MPIFPKVDYIEAQPVEKFGVWEDEKRGGQYDNGLIIIFAPVEQWGNEPIWLARRLFHEFLHHIFDSIRCQFLHKFLHHPAIRCII